MNAEFSFASIATLKQKLARKEISREQLLAYYKERFAQLDPELGTALEIFDTDSILLTSSDAPTGLLYGIPGLVKDNICQQGRITSCASKMLQNYRAPYDATVTSRLKQAGALIMGRANMDEFAMGSSTETSAFQKTKNPWDRTRVPGGSSGGSIAAVAAGLVPWALGTETGGSVRQPAALCGIVGFKPTYGLISRYGVVAYGSSLDQVGIATRTVEDTALVLSALAGSDEHDSSSRPVAPRDYTKSLTGKLPAGFKLGVIANALNTQGIDPEVYKALEDAIAQFKQLGAEISYVTLPTMDYSAAVYFMLSRAEAASNLARFDGVRYGYRSPESPNLEAMYDNSRYQGFGREVQRRILVGNYVLSAGHAEEYYTSAKVVQRMMREQFLHAYTSVDLLFAPVSPTAAFKFGAFAHNTLALDLQDYFTAAANLTGAPALALPCGFTQDKLPIGFQLMGPELSEDLMFQVGHAYEQQTPWHTMHPKL